MSPKSPNVFANRRAATDATHSSVYFAHTHHIKTHTQTLVLTRTFMLIDENMIKEVKTLTNTHTQASEKEEI